MLKVTVLLAFIQRSTDYNNVWIGMFKWFVQYCLVFLLFYVKKTSSAQNQCVYFYLLVVDYAGPSIDFTLKHLVWLDIKLYVGFFLHRTEFQYFLNTINRVSRPGITVLLCCWVLYWVISTYFHAKCVLFFLRQHEFDHLGSSELEFPTWKHVTTGQLSACSAQ